MSTKKDTAAYSFVITPHNKLWSIDWREILQSRDLLELFVWRNIVVQYKQTILGPLWYVVQPVLTVLMNMLVFGGIARMSTDGVPQALFYMAGNICWFYFSDCLSQTSSTFVANQHMFGKVYFPRLVVPVSVVISNLLRFLIQLCIFIVMYVYYVINGGAIMPNWTILLLPLYVIIISGLGLGFGILVSSMTTKYRDLSILFTFVVQLWMYATPIVYPISIVNDKTLATFILLNPMTGVIEAFKFSTLGHGMFSWLWIGYSFFIMLVLLTLSIMVFNKVQRTFMDTV